MNLPILDVIPELPSSTTSSDGLHLVDPATNQPVWPNIFLLIVVLLVVLLAVSILVGYILKTKKNKSGK